MSKQNKIIGLVFVIAIAVVTILIVRNAILQTPPPPPTPPPGLPVPIDGGVLVLMLSGLFLGIKKYLKN